MRIDLNANFQAKNINVIKMMFSKAKTLKMSARFARRGTQNPQISIIRLGVFQKFSPTDQFIWGFQKFSPVKKRNKVAVIIIPALIAVRLSNLLVPRMKWLLVTTNPN